MLPSTALAHALVLVGATSTTGLTLDDLVDAALARPAAIRVDQVSTEAASEYNLSRASDGRTAVFARSGPAFSDAKIYWAREKNGRMTAPEPVGFSDPRWRDSDPWLTPDGRTLYFVSDRPAAGRSGRTDLDIWLARRSNDGWSAPEHLGDLVNGRGEELGPEVHEGRLYFSTARRSGLGGLDIYSAPVTGGTFGAPELLPAPINSASSESDFTISPDGRSALFWRMVGNRGVLHRAVRTQAGWASPEPLPVALNFGGFNFTPAFSPDGRTITFASAATGDDMADVFEATHP